MRHDSRLPARQGIGLSLHGVLVDHARITHSTQRMPNN
jgi:hypothetical protein